MKIKSVEAIPLAAEFERPFRFAGVDRISSQNVIVVIRSDEGVAGFGEACPVPHLSAMSQQAIAHVVETIASPLLEGADPLAYRPLMTQLRKAISSDPFSLAALDTALLDLVGKSLNVSITTLLGGAYRETVPVHASVGWSEDGSTMIDEALSLIDQYTYLKVYLGRGELEDDLGKLAALREAVGAATQLMLDINAQWTATETLKALPTLDELAVCAIEQPIAPGDVEGQRRVVQQSPIDIVLDEAIQTSNDVATAGRLATGTVVNVGHSKLGGVLSAQAAATAAYASGLGVAVGSVAELGVATAAGLHLAAALPTLSYPSYLTGYKRYKRQISEPWPVKPGGLVDVPSGPGLGIAIDEEAIEDMDARSGRR